jgi:NAD(P)-dependent dehydrogenase (short-subunit alcohol dehydrogenase family)
MKKVIITGAGGNLGAAVTKEFLDKNYQVIATVGNEAMRSEIPENERLDIQLVNLANEEESGHFIQNCIEKYKTIDAALLLVGGFAMGDLASTSGADLHKQISLNFETAYYVTRPLFAHMMEKKQGRIIFIGARPAILASQGHDMLAYSLSKSLLFTLAEFLNEEAKGTNVTVSVIVPSTLDTPVNRKSMPDTNPQNLVKPSDIAAILEFVVSDKGGPLRETVLKVYNNA